MLAEQKKSWSPHSKDATFIHPNISKLEIWALQSSRCSSLYWRILSCDVSRHMQDLCHRQVQAVANSVLRVTSVIHNTLSLEYFVLFSLYHCPLDCIVCKVSDTFYFIHSQLYFFSGILVEIQSMKFMLITILRTKEDMGGLWVFLNLFFFLIYTVYSGAFI